MKHGQATPSVPASNHSAHALGPLSVYGSCTPWMTRARHFERGLMEVWRGSKAEKCRSQPKRIYSLSIAAQQRDDTRGHALTIAASAGNQVTNPPLRIASQAMNDMQRIGAQFGLTPNGRLRLSGMKMPSPPSKFDGLLGS